jgi:molybdopterin biosynthesis protein
MDALGAVAGSASAADERVLVVSVDTPGVARLARLLVAAMDRAEARREKPAPGWDGTPPRGPVFHAGAGSGPGPQSAPAQGRRADGALILGGEPRPFRQYLQAVYRCDALRSALEGAGALRGRAVGRTLGGMRLVEVPVRAGLCRDLDTPGDLEFWRGRFAASADADAAPDG